MAFTMAAQVERYFNAFFITQSQMIEVADGALRDAGELWVEAFLPKHFEWEAHLRYNYRWRSHSWNENKYRGRIPAGGFFTKQNRRRGIIPPNLVTQIVPHEKGKARPFDARGEMKHLVMSNNRMAITGKSKGASSLVLKIYLPFGHPIPPEFKGEMTRVNDYEMERLQQTFHAGVRKRIKDGGYQRQPGVQFSNSGYPMLNAA